MTEENGEQKSGIVSDTMNAAANLAKAVPVYEDALQPIAREAGKALGTVGRCVNAALVPVKGLVWGVEKIEAWMDEKVAGKLKDVEPDKIVAPDLSIAGPTVEALKFHGSKDELSDMFAELLATSMNADVLEIAHPGYVPLISAMSTFDANVILVVSKKPAFAIGQLRRENKKGEGLVVRDHFAPDLYSLCGVSTPELADRFVASIDNLRRLGLLEVTYENYLVKEGAYEHIENAPEVIKLKEQLSKATELNEMRVVMGMLSLTMFGRNFAKACLPKQT